MAPALTSSLGIVAYLALFSSVGIVFLFANLLVGWLLRPHDPHAEKQEIYECGEPTIGSSFVQFDLRFYVVALVFIVFDVEVAFLFPWATVFGKANHLDDLYTSGGAEAVAVLNPDGSATLSPTAQRIYRELGVAEQTLPTTAAEIPATLRGAVQGQLSAGSSQAEVMAATVRAGGRQLALVSAAVMGVFFVVLLIGFAYEWKSGAFDWVRAITRERGEREREPHRPTSGGRRERQGESVLSA